MDWIKKNYDKLLLGLFGIFALAVGGILSASAFTAADEAGTKRNVVEKAELGPDKGAEAKKSLADLTANAGKPVWSSVKIAEHRSAHLFTASPVIQKAGSENVVQLLDPSTEALREGIPNWWLYENGLDLTRDDVAATDFDGDKFTNLEEFEGGSNPRDPDSRPPFYAKLRLVEVIEVPYELWNKGVEGTPEKPEIQLSRRAPKGPNDKTFGKLNYHLGDVAFDDDKRFTIKAVEERELLVDGQKQMVQHVILTDSKNGDKPVAVPVGMKNIVNLPTYKAKVKSLLSAKEDVRAENEDFVVPDFPGIKVRLQKIIPPDMIEIEFNEPGKPKGKAQLKLTK